MNQLRCGCGTGDRAYYVGVRGRETRARRSDAWIISASFRFGRHSARVARPRMYWALCSRGDENARWGSCFQAPATVWNHFVVENGPSPFRDQCRPMLRMGARRDLFRKEGWRYGERETCGRRGCKSEDQRTASRRQRITLRGAKGVGRMRPVRIDRLADLIQEAINGDAEFARCFVGAGGDLGADVIDQTLADFAGFSRLRGGLSGW